MPRRQHSVFAFYHLTETKDRPNDETLCPSTIRDKKWERENEASGTQGFSSWISGFRV